MAKQKTILVVEDDENIREIVLTTLKLGKFHSIVAANGQEGVQLALEKHPDLILLDLLMPVMGGMEAFKRIREDKWGATVPVIILTNLNATNEDLVEDIVTLKPSHYLIKSDWRVATVIQKINEILEKAGK
ncbi:response regulator [Candidatus Parcubacteria bacterium]|nr:response regulator [Candidatus Parcubacteria bacterium]